VSEGSCPAAQSVKREGGRKRADGDKDNETKEVTKAQKFFGEKILV